MLNSIKNGNKEQRVSLRRYWTNRYLLTLIIGLAVITLISALWIRHNTLENRLNMMIIMAQGIADRFDTPENRRTFPDEDLPNLYDIERNLANSNIKPVMYIIDNQGTVLSSNKPTGPFYQKLNPAIVNNEETIQEISLSDGDYYVVKVPITIQKITVGSVVMLESKERLSQVNQEYSQLAIMIVSLALLGWAAIYILTGRLSKPIREVANAAKEVARGNYQVELSTNGSKEQEVYELIHSFKEMTSKLEKLEALRTELLAGVTHELKTPITSISGLLQAMKDDVVSGEEAKEFLKISLNETEKMKKMVEDLLSFNQFAANAVAVNKELLDINQVTEEAVHIWKTAQEDDDLQIRLSPLPSPLKIRIDPLRFQQIITNLLNNAKQAINGGGEIRIHMSADDKQIMIDVQDTGTGIPEKEQPYIFERFFRGEDKKYQVRGLGLGLSLSKMIAQALGGDLILLTSTNEGTTFRILLPVNG